MEQKHSSPYDRCEQSWPPAVIAAGSARHETQGSKQSLEPRSAVEAGAHLGERARDHPFHCECSPFCHSNKSPLAQKSKLNNLAHLSSGKVTTPRITDNSGKFCVDSAAYATGMYSRLV
jgi:hypothetical protein